MYMTVIIDTTHLVLHTDRLLLRAFRPDDLAGFYEYAKVPGVGEMAGWHAHTTIQETKKVLNVFLAHKNNFAVVYRDKLIGSFGFNGYDTAVFPEFASLNVAHFGYVIAKEFWGRGLASELCAYMVGYTFEQTAADLILASAFDDNSRSARVQEKVGFKPYKSFMLETAARTAPATARIIRRSDYEHAEKI